MREIDLHVHTNGSDGTCAPEEAVKIAAETGLRAIAVTDHDSVLAYGAAAEAGKRCGVEVVPGIEISTKFHRAVHILGYYIDPHSPHLEPVLNWVVQDRDERNKKMAALMAADGLPVDYEQMHERFGPVIGRPHFDRMLMELGLADRVSEAFDKYVEKDENTTSAAIFCLLSKALKSSALRAACRCWHIPFSTSWTTGGCAN